MASRIKKLEDKGLLKDYTVILDPVKLGYDLTAVIFVQTQGAYIKDLEKELSQMSNVITIYEITGDFDLVAIVKLKNKDSLNTLIKNLLITPHIKKTMTNLAFNIVKEDFRVNLWFEDLTPSNATGSFGSLNKSSAYLIFILNLFSIAQNLYTKA